MDAVIPLRIIPGSGIEILDQTLLPHEERYLRIDSIEALCEAIAALRVRGAPLLGLAGAAGVAIAAQTGAATDAELRAAAKAIDGTRPTAVDLGRAAQEALAVALACAGGAEERRERLWQHALAYAARREGEDRELGRLGAAIIPPGAAVLTHCNAGLLATGGIGTALGVVRTAWEAGRLRRCYATETRPLLQGARLTAWELVRSGIPVTLLSDTAAASLIASGAVQAVVTGADRIAANGDAANKIGTYGLALAAHRHGVPFIIAAPTSTLDLQCRTGAGIPVELRSGDEVGGFAGQRWAPTGIDAYNPAFDVTPHELVGAIVTERGVVRAPYSESLAALGVSGKG